MPVSTRAQKKRRIIPSHGSIQQLDDVEIFKIMEFLETKDIYLGLVHLCHFMRYLITEKESGKNFPIHATLNIQKLQGKLAIPKHVLRRATKVTLKIPVSADFLSKNLPTLEKLTIDHYLYELRYFDKHPRYFTHDHHIISNKNITCGLNFPEKLRALKIVSCSTDKLEKILKKNGNLEEIDIHSVYYPLTNLPKAQIQEDIFSIICCTQKHLKKFTDRNSCITLSNFFRLKTCEHFFGSLHYDLNMDTDEIMVNENLTVLHSNRGCQSWNQQAVENLPRFFPNLKCINFALNIHHSGEMALNCDFLRRFQHLQSVTYLTRYCTDDEVSTLMDNIYKNFQENWIQVRENSYVIIQFPTENEAKLEDYKICCPFALTEFCHCSV